MDRMQFIQASHSASKAQANIATVTATIERLKKGQADAERLGITDITTYPEMLHNAEARLAKYQQILAESIAIITAYKAQKNADQ